MKASLKTLELLQQRFKHIADVNTSSKQLRQLGRAVANISKLETTDDILEFSDKKLNFLLENANSKVRDLKMDQDTKISQLKGKKYTFVADINTSKEENVYAIEDLANSKQVELNTIVDNFGLINDIPLNSSIKAEVESSLAKHKFLKNKGLPFVFGILSRYDDYYGVGGFTTALGTWYNAEANTMFSFLTGSHGYTTDYTGFYLEPKLCFLQGSEGNFIRKKSYMKYDNTTSMYKYPYAALGCLFVSNVTNEEISSTIDFGGTSYTSTGGASMFVGTPDHVSKVITWTNVYSYSSSSTGFSNSASISIPPNTTACILLYTSSYYISTPTNGSSSYGYHVQFLHWRLNKIRSAFLIDGLEIDFEKTLKAWQCPGFTNSYDLWK